MVYVVEMYEKAARALGTSSPLKRTASCWQQLAYASSYGSRLTVIPVGSCYGKPKLMAGDIFIMRADHRTDPELIGQASNGHTGMVMSDRGASEDGVEGNTNKRGSRNGDRVALRERAKSTILAVIRV